MTAQIGATTTASPTPTTADTARLYQDGIVAGIIGAATVAVWFLILDTLNGRPLHTPTVLGVALFRRGTDLATLSAHPVALDMVLMFTWVHGMVFAGLGGLASRLLGMVERHPSAGFGVVLLFVIFEFGFTVAATLFAEPVLKVLTWPAVLVANLLAAAAMAGYFRLRHPTLRVNP
jgi:hypothetical protein